MSRLTASVFASLLLATPVMAQQADPAVSTVEALHAGLIGIMKAGGNAGQAGRSRAIAPVIDRTFDIAAMTRLSVGPDWLKMTPQNQSGLTAAFRAMTISQYAKNFSDYGGESFRTGGVQDRGGDKLVLTNLVISRSESESLNYRLRQNGGQWKIIDVYYRNAISQLATRRADFANVLKTGGAPALIAHLNELAARPK